MSIFTSVKNSQLLHLYKLFVADDVGVNSWADFDEDAPGIDAFDDGENNCRPESLPKSAKKKMDKEREKKVQKLLIVNFSKFDRKPGSDEYKFEIKIFKMKLDNFRTELTHYCCQRCVQTYNL